MTREEIMALKPGPEMDALVLEHVMGWQRITAWWVLFKGSELLRRPGERDPKDMVLGKSEAWDDGERARKCSPSTDIAAAMETKGRMNDLGWWWTIRCRPARRCAAALYKPGELRAPRIVSENLAEAICKSALLATLAEETPSA